MRDHQRILGTLFMAWSVVQLAVAIILAMTGRGIEIPYPALYWISTVLVSVAYAWTGWRLRLHDPRVKVLAILLSVFALLSIPLGTAMGIYGLFAILRRRKAELPAD